MLRSPGPGERWPDGPEDALWITLGNADKGYPETVEDLVPATYEAYARIFHPVHLPGLGDMRWGQAARLNGREPRRGMQLPDILELGVSSSGRPKLVGDSSNQLSRLDWHELGPILRRHTSSDISRWAYLEMHS